MTDNRESDPFVQENEPPLEAVIRDRLILLQLMRDGLTPRHLLALERLAESRAH